MIVNDEVRKGEVFEIETTDSGGIFAHLPWWLILTVAVIVTELTAHPSVGVTVLCLKFGWSDFRTALWLRRRDPNRRRGAVCSWFYFSSGVWRVCVWSFALMFITVMFGAAIGVLPQAGRGVPQNGNAPPPVEMITCMIVWLVSSGVANILTVIAGIKAWRHRTKVWISGSIAESRQRNEWPPRPVYRGRPTINLMSVLRLPTGILMFIALFLIAFVPFVVFVVRPNGPPPARIGSTAIILWLIVSFVGALTIVVLSSGTYLRLVAFSPYECWPDHELDVDRNTSELRRRSCKSLFIERS